VSLGDRYAAAERLLPHQLDVLLPAAGAPTWLPGSESFRYGRGSEHVLVDPVARATGLVAEPDAPRPEPGTSVSPDGRWVVRVRDHDLVLVDAASGAERQLTADGAAGWSYATEPDVGISRFTVELFELVLRPVVAWSPDSTRFVTHRVDQRALPLLGYVQSSPPDGSRPRGFMQHYAMPGEEHVATAELVVVDVAGGRLTWADCGPLLVPYRSPISTAHLWWDDDGSAVHFVDFGRADRVARLRQLDPGTGETTVLIEETSATHVQVNPAWLRRPNARVLSSGEIVWWSERSGWGHLYLYGRDGSARALTQGDWVVRDLLHVDGERRTAVFTASGREVGLDPYVRQLYRVPLDGGDVEQLSDDELDHDVVASPSGRFLVDRASYVDRPERSRVLDADGTVVLELGHADASALRAAGWEAPERFTVKAADGETDLWGLLFRPHGLDPAWRYPVLDDIYPGPQVGAAGIRFCTGAPRHAASMAALGFAVVVLDARGTPLRGKAFQDHCRGERDADWLDDHAAAIAQLGDRYPWLDTGRVGIYGHSGGGRASTAALLRRPDVFHVAVSVAGNHDDRLNHPVWSEKYHGPVDEADYEAHANATYASQLEGKLFLIHGELDDNVHPPMTLRLVDALIAANKDFDLLLVPNADHAMLIGQSYWIRRRWDFVVRHLLHVEPPSYRIADIPVDREQLQP
jgi:dipeptidyl aminopeptidase/acylaminoacyl peptidase